MTSPLKEQLRAYIDRSTRIVEIVGFTSLTCFSLSLPELTAKSLNQFAAQFSTFADFRLFFEPKIAPLLLIAVTVFWYYRYKGAVINELGLVDDAFDADHAPRRVGMLDGA